MAGDLDSLLKQFVTRQGIAEVKPDPAGRYFFVLDGSLELTLFQVGNQIIVEGKIQTLPEDEHVAAGLLTKSLQRNLIRLRKKHEALSIDPEDGSLMLFRRLAARRLDIDELEQALGEFANAMDFWNQAASGSPQATAPSPPSPMNLLFP